MPRVQIKNHRTGTVLFEGDFTTAKACVEQAVRDSVCLDYADLHNANLCNAMLDDALMRHARLDYANLTGANLSEARLDGTSFASATLHASCLCYSSLNNANFDSAQFGATDITGCALRKGRFSGLSAFTLNFIDAGVMDNCLYRSTAGVACPLSKPPLVLQGMDLPVILLDRHLKIGPLVRPFRDWFHTNDNSTARHHADSHINDFFERHHTFLEVLCLLVSIKSIDDAQIFYTLDKKYVKVVGIAIIQLYVVYVFIQVCVGYWK